MDEALTAWLNGEVDRPIRRGFKSDIMGGRHEIERSFDLRGYTKGAQMFVRVSEDLGEQELIDFLAELHAERAFEPFTTDEFVDDLVDYTGDPTWAETFDGWLRGGGCATVGQAGLGWAWAPLILLYSRRKRSTN